MKLWHIYKKTYILFFFGEERLLKSSHRSNGKKRREKIYIDGADILSKRV